MSFVTLGGRLTCAECGGDITEGDEYFRVEDNFIQANYFESEKDNVFCSQDCLCDSLSVQSYYLEEKEKE